MSDDEDKAVVLAVDDTPENLDVVKGILVPYFGADGNLQVNNFRTVSEMNRYIIPGLRVVNTSQKIKGFVGLKGNYTSAISYDIGFSYALYGNMPFFINDSVR